MDSSRTLYLVSGMPASGKSTFARELARRTNACLIDIDTSTEPLVQAAMAQLVGDPHDRDSPTFKQTFRAAIYDTLFAIADENLPHSDAIITGPFTKELANPRWREIVKGRLQTPCHVRCVFAHCDPDLRRKRITERANPRDEAKLKNWEDYLKYYDPDAFPSYPHVRVDTGSPAAFEAALGEAID
jgi:predicted kinase